MVQVTCCASAKPHASRRRDIAPDAEFGRLRTALVAAAQVDASAPGSAGDSGVRLSRRLVTRCSARGHADTFLCISRWPPAPQSRVGGREDPDRPALPTLSELQNPGSCPSSLVSRHSGFPCPLTVRLAEAAGHSGLGDPVPQRWRNRPPPRKMSSPGHHLPSP